MKVLLTGGAGYIGSHLARRLHRGGHSLVALDDLSTGRAAAIGGVQLIRGDVRDRELVEAAVRDVDAIVHLAGLKDAGASVRMPGVYFSANVEGSRVVLDAAAAVGVRFFLFSSSCATYGEPAELPVGETAALRPLNPYGESKLMVERMLSWFELTGGPRWISLRYANVAGAHPEGDIGECTEAPSNLVPRVMAALTGRMGPVEVFGRDYPTRDGTPVRDYVHVMDVAEAHALALDYLARGGRSLAMNIGTGRGASVQEVLDAAARVSGQIVPSIDAPRRPGDLAEFWPSIELARQVLGWSPAFDLDSTLGSAWRWHSTSAVQIQP